MSIKYHMFLTHWCYRFS